MVGVTRIIAGQAGSLPLDVPDAGTRPTSDRVREALFSALEAADAIRDARVLDLYAGSGALGLEAISRGAASADLVEKAPRAAAVARKNAERVSRAVGVAASARVHRASVDAFLRAATGPFDLVLIDPPYDLTDDALTTTLALLTPLVAEGADVIVERAKRSAAPVLPEGLVATRSRTYGDTTLWWASTP